MTGTEYGALAERSLHEAHRAIFDDYCDYVYAIAFNRLRNTGTREDIEECVSDIFADIYQIFDEEKTDSGDIKILIGTVAKRRAVDFYRMLNAKKRKTVFLENEEIVSDTDIEEDNDRNELRNAMLSEINNLGEPDSTILILKYYYNRTSEEIAKKLSMTAVSVRKRCERAMKKLRSRFEQLDIDMRR